MVIKFGLQIMAYLQVGETCLVLNSFATLVFVMWSEWQVMAYLQLGGVDFIITFYAWELCL